jgi:hypothetical protein
MAFAAFAVPVPFDGPIESVAVYTSGFAQVTRTAEVQLGAGETILESKPLPPAADISSILVSIQGKQAAILAVEMRRVLADDQDPDAKFHEFLEEYRKQDDNVFNAQRELSAIDERMQSRRETLAMLEKMREKSAQAADREMSIQKPDADGWGKMIAMAQLRADTARAEIRECIAQRREVERRYAAASKKLYDIRRKAPKGCSLPEYGENRFFDANALPEGSGSNTSAQQQAAPYHRQDAYISYQEQTYQTYVIITVAAKAAVKAKLSLKYNVNGANWTPTYRVNADINAKTAQLDVQGEVRQSSGEDWNGVNLSLSTARPDLGTDVPVLMPWYIRAGSIETAPKEMETNEMQSAEDLATATEPSADESSSPGMATVFTSQTKTTIPSDNEAHRIPVTSISSSIKVEHVAIPKILQYAFVQAKLANRAAFALVPGVVEVMVGGNYLGRGMMKATAPGEEIKLSLGIDEQLKIRLKTIDNKGERKARSGRVQSNNAFEISAVSYKEADLRLTVIDQLPISADRRISVTYGPEAKKALRGAEYPGQLKWELTLAPKKPQAIKFDFTVEYPEELRQQLQADDIEYNFNQFEAEEKSASPELEQAAQTNWKNARKKGKVRQSVKF